ncbi:MAG TPA: biopolymer transporter ExbD [Burkholderiales bacterium]
MPRRHHYRRHKEAPELDITTFLNLMVVLIPFLLVTAVFSRITIMELDLPTAAGGAASSKPQVTIEVIVRKNALQIADGRSVTLSIPMKDGKYDLPKLSEYLQRLKATYPDKEDATVLVEPDIEYEHVVHVMDAVRVAEIRQPGSDVVEKRELFPAISVGDAP